MEALDLALKNLVSAPLLFFILGMLAAAVRSDLTIPQAVAKSIALYLMMAIGFKGGVAVAERGLSTQLVVTLLLSVAASALLPLLAYGLLRLMTRLGRIDAAAVAGHYGSISVVTFVAATQALNHVGIEYEGFMVAAAAAMETPAIFAALFLAGKSSGNDGTDGGGERGALIREIVFNGSIVLLTGSFAIGIVAGPEALNDAKAFLVEPFKGVLMLFLLDMGLVAGRALKRGGRDLKLPVFVFAALMPLLGGSVGLLAALLAQLSVGGSLLMMVLCASASYIAAPAAMRLALPEANPGIYLTLSLGVTFPFNLLIGIPLYLAVARTVVGVG
ncbi:MAG: sodium-dependent bicarbonate transport family permease [Myxococcota bacterium]